MLTSESITFCGLLTSDPCTRQIERGMNPKTVQVILGHSSVNIIMNLYCHVTEDTLISEMSKFEAEESEKGVNRRIGVKVM